MAVYEVIVLSPKKKLMFSFCVDKGLVNLNGKTDDERIDFILAEVPKLSEGTE